MAEQEALPLFNLGKASAADESAVTTFSGPGVPLHEGQVQFVAGILSQYAFGGKPSVAQREAAIETAREALTKLAAVAALLGELEAADSDLELTGYASAEIDAMLRELHRPAADPDAAPPTPANPRSRVGHVYDLGAHRLCGDATNQGDVEALVATDGPIEAIWTDPPYGVAYQSKLSIEDAVAWRRRLDGLEVANDSLTPGGTRHLVRDALIIARLHLAPGGAFYICTPSGDLELQFRLALLDAEYELRQQIAWVKDVFVMGRQDYHWRHESILYGWLPGGAHRWYGGRNQDTVWEITRPKRSAEHPTMKPVELVQRALANSTSRGDCVIDPFAGSGTTLIAAERTGRRAFAMEIDPAYCDVIRQRYADYVGDQKWAP